MLSTSGRPRRADGSLQCPCMDALRRCCPSPQGCLEPAADPPPSRCRRAGRSPSRERLVPFRRTRKRGPTQAPAQAGAGPIGARTIELLQPSHPPRASSPARSLARRFRDGKKEPVWKRSHQRMVTRTPLGPAPSRPADLLRKAGARRTRRLSLEAPARPRDARL